MSTTRRLNACSSLRVHIAAWRYGFSQRTGQRVLAARLRQDVVLSIPNQGGLANGSGCWDTAFDAGNPHITLIIKRECNVELLDIRNVGDWTDGGACLAPTHLRTYATTHHRLDGVRSSPLACSSRRKPQYPTALGWARLAQSIPPGCTKHSSMGGVKRESWEAWRGRNWVEGGAKRVSGAKGQTLWEECGPVWSSRAADPGRAEKDWQESAEEVRLDLTAFSYRGPPRRRLVVVVVVGRAVGLPVPVSTNPSHPR